MAIVAGDGPNALVTHLSREARKRGLRVGLSQGVARNLVPDLRTRIVTDAERDALHQDLARGLQLFSPRVTIEERFEGCFTVDPTGLGPLFGGMAAWTRAVHAYLKGRGLWAAVVVGRHRYRTLVSALSMNGPAVLSAEEESSHSDVCTLPALGAPENIADPLALLTVRTVDALRAPPLVQLETRL